MVSLRKSCAAMRSKVEPEGWPSMAPLAAGKLGADLGAIIGGSNTSFLPCKQSVPLYRQTGIYTLSCFFRGTSEVVK